MSARRHDSHARSAAAARTVSDVRVVSDGPSVEGEHEVTYVLVLHCYRARYCYGPGVVSGCGDTPDEAVERAQRVAAEILGRSSRAAEQGVAHV